MPCPSFLSDTKWDLFLLVHKYPMDFILAKWCDSPVLYAVWSTICSLYTLSMVLYSGFQSQYGIKILIWLTYWAFYSVALRFTITAGNCWLFILRERKHRTTISNKYLVQTGISEDTGRPTDFELKMNHEDFENGISGQCFITDNTEKRDSVSLCSEKQCHNVEDYTCNEDPSDQSREAYLIEDAGTVVDGNIVAKIAGNLDRKGQCQSLLPVPVACQWFTQNISNSVSFLVTVLYWLLVYTGEPQDYASINSHVINSLLVTGDILLSRAPVRMQHFHIPLTFLSIYIGFTLVYWSLGGTNHKGQCYIYSSLDYSNKPTKAAVMICLMASLGMLLLQSYVYFLYRLRNALYNFKRSGIFSMPKK